MNFFQNRETNKNNYVMNKENINSNQLMNKANITSNQLMQDKQNKFSEHMFDRNIGEYTKQGLPGYYGLSGGNSNSTGEPVAKYWLGGATTYGNQPIGAKGPSNFTPRQQWYGFGIPSEYSGMGSASSQMPRNRNPGRSQGTRDLLNMLGTDNPAQTHWDNMRRSRPTFDRGTNAQNMRTFP